MLQSELDLILPYISSDLPGVGGVLRAAPDDFVVEEVPLYEAQGDGQHLYVNITKVGLTTKEVQLGLERLFGLKKGDVSFAGMKDKRARTTQTFSLNVGHKPPVFAEMAGAQIETGLPVKVNWVRFHSNKLKPGHLLGNRFVIRIRELASAPEDVLPQAQAIVERLKSTGLPNYFGSQRLGEGGANVRQGWSIVHGERGKRDRWLQRFLISAYQSYLCNRYLAERLPRVFRATAGRRCREEVCYGRDVRRRGCRRGTAPVYGTGDKLYGALVWPADVDGQRRSCGT